MLIRIYLYMGMVSDTPESAETVISETPYGQGDTPKYKQTNKHHVFMLTPALSRYPQLLLAAHRKKAS